MTRIMGAIFHPARMEKLMKASARERISAKKDGGGRYTNKKEKKKKMINTSPHSPHPDHGPPIMQ